jgi:hypothetical protein
MAITVDEFVNPKSMLTPGAAAAVVATISGALFSMTGLTIAGTLILLSFFVGAVVFHSKEFSDPSMKLWVKWFFYILNSFIIFAMATGTHAVLDKDRRAENRASMPGLFIATASAQSSQPTSPVLTQQRPFFYDWTKGASDSPVVVRSKTNPIVFKAEEDFGPVKGFFVNAGLATPDYKVTVEIDKSKLPIGAQIKAVKWNLPQQYFDTSDITLTESTRNYAVSIEAWKPFKIGADIELTSGQILQWDNAITFNPIEQK